MMNHCLQNSSSIKEENFAKMIQNVEEIFASAPINSEWTTMADLYKYQGFWYPPEFLEGTITAQDQFKAQPSDIILCSAPKSGTTWLKALACAIMNRDSLDDSTTNPLLSTAPHDCVPFLELDLLEQKKSIPSTRSTSLWATHIPYTSLPESIISSGCKIVYICRDPKDVVVSLWHFVGNEKSGGKKFPLEKAVDLFCRGISLHGPFWDHVLGYWEASLKWPERVLFMTYEKLHKETSFHVKRLAQFMGYPVSEREDKEGVVEKIIQLCSFKHLGNLEVNKTGGYAIPGSHVVENNMFFRKGEVGDWMNYLTVGMREQIEYISEKHKLRSYGITFS